MDQYIINMSANLEGMSTIEMIILLSIVMIVVVIFAKVFKVFSI